MCKETIDTGTRLMKSTRSLLGSVQGHGQMHLSLAVRQSLVGSLRRCCRLWMKRLLTELFLPQLRLATFSEFVILCHHPCLSY
jgi:hypothetical protein